MIPWGQVMHWVVTSEPYLSGREFTVDDLRVHIGVDLASCAITNVLANLFSKGLVEIVGRDRYLRHTAHPLLRVPFRTERFDWEHRGPGPLEWNR